MQVAGLVGGLGGDWAEVGVQGFCFCFGVDGDKLATCVDKVLGLGFAWATDLFKQFADVCGVGLVSLGF
ncbi:MAG: hypothetical protein Rsou_2091 [Candidatus Ruthia sp. Asou_11_S2]|nr:hypothetical protein [Candidatus Ruthia sp. Asou_11_S2]